MSANNKPTILIISHGDLCSALIRTTSMIYGEMEDVSAIELVEGQSPEEYCEKLRAAVERSEGNVLVLVDIVGGTPFNSVMKLGRERAMYAVAGVSVPVLLEALEQREQCPLAELPAAIAENCAGSVVDMGGLLARIANK